MAIVPVFQTAEFRELVKLGRPLAVEKVLAIRGLSANVSPEIVE